MKNSLVTLIIFLTSSLGFAGNSGGGGTGAIDMEDESIIFESLDSDMVYYRLAYFNLTEKKWHVQKMSMPLRGIDPKYVEALKASIEAKTWAAVKATDVDCESYQIVTVSLTANRNIPQCVFPRAAEH